MTILELFAIGSLAVFVDVIAGFVYNRRTAMFVVACVAIITGFLLEQHR